MQKRELKECIRMTSVSCTSEPQVGPNSSIVVLINSSSSYFSGQCCSGLGTRGPDHVHGPDQHEGRGIRFKRGAPLDQLGHWGGQGKLGGDGHQQRKDRFPRCPPEGWCQVKVSYRVRQVINAKSRLDLVGDMSGLAPGHLAVGHGPALLAILLNHRDFWDINIRCNHVVIKGGGSRVKLGFF